LKNDKVLPSGIYQGAAPSKVPPKPIAFINHGKIINSLFILRFHKFGGSFDGGHAGNAFFGEMPGYPQRTGSPKGSPHLF
jgi:hypothetical protein